MRYNCSRDNASYTGKTHHVDTLEIPHVAHFTQNELEYDTNTTRVSSLEQKQLNKLNVLLLLRFVFRDSSSCLCTHQVMPFHLSTCTTAHCFLKS
jgi:hypothetical protein